MKYFLIALLFLFFIRCEKKKKPIIIPQERFIDLLIDYHLANAMAYTNVFRNKSKEFKDFNLKDSVIKNYGYTKAIFDSTVSYYTSVPEKYEVIYDSVVTRISRKQAHLQKIMSDKSEKERKAERDLINKSMNPKNKNIPVYKKGSENPQVNIPR